VTERIEVERLIDEQKLGLFNVNLIAWSFLAMFADGYEITAMAFAAPELVRIWGVETSSLGPVFSASLFGIFFGAPLLGYIGDRWGRKMAIVLGCIICGSSTLAMMFAGNLDQLFALRVITGIGIGGLMPNTVSLTSELSPKRFRAMLIVLMFTGITLGGGTPSVVAAWLVPQFGWQVLFLIGGVVPLVIAIGVAFFLPESIKFLALHEDRRAKLISVAREVRPDIAIADTAAFEFRQSMPGSGIGLRQIFSFGLQWITPLLWFCFGMTLMANYFLNSWMPVLFVEMGLPPDRAALASGLYHVGGTLGGLMISALIDRYGFVVISTLLLLGGPVVAGIGVESLAYPALLVLSLAAGICVLGAQFGNNAAAGLLYPTEIRAKAVGWAFSMGRFGSILGPLIGGMLLARSWALSDLFLAAAVPLVAAAAAALIMTRICFVRFKGLPLDDTPAAD
jgi:AAHS family 4-hydroxybenzoate transporter-like MFS transporter